MVDSDSDSDADSVAGGGVVGGGGAAAPQIGSAGQGQSVRTSRTRSLKLLEMLRTTDPVPPAVSAAIPLHPDYLTQSQWTNKELYELFAGFLAETYVQVGGANDGARLNPKTALGYLGALIQAAKGKCKEQSAETKLFFACADPGAMTEHAAWYRGVRRNLEDAMFRKAVEEDQNLDNSPDPLFIGHLRSMVRVCVLPPPPTTRGAHQLNTPPHHPHQHPPGPCPFPSGQQRIHGEGCCREGLCTGVQPPGLWACGGGVVAEVHHNKVESPL